MHHTTNLLKIKGEETMKNRLIDKEYKKKYRQ